MKITLIWPGRTKEAFIKEGIQKYVKDITRLAEVRIVEVKEDKGARSLELQGQRILRQAPRGGFVLMDEKGRKMSSAALARWLQDRAECGFVVGGPYGVSDEVKDSALMRLSFSPMTLPHELMRLVLLEQIYRALTIIKGTGYHHA